MYHSSVQTLWIYMVCIIRITGKGKCDADVVCAITGLNASLQWTLDLDEYWAKSSTINVFNERGIEIANIKDSVCEKRGDTSVYCEKLNTTEKWVFKMVLINVTPANTGRYTCQITTTNKTYITKELIVIDKPQIRMSRKAILDETLYATCSADEKDDGIKHRWKLNGRNLNSTGDINIMELIVRLESKWTDDNSSNITCEVCKENRCCVPSLPFALDQYFSSALASSPEYRKDYKIEHIALGLAIVAVLLVIAGIVMIQKIRHYRNIKLVSHTLHQRSQEQVNNEASEDVLSLETPNRPLPIPQQQTNARRNHMRSNDPNIRRKSMSVPRLADYTKYIWTPEPISVSLRTLIQLSQTVGRFTNNDDMVINKCSSNEDSWSSMDGSAKGIRRMEIYSKDINVGKISNGEQSIGLKSQGLNTHPSGHFKQEDLSNTAACFVYDYAATNDLEENQNEGCRNTGARNYVYDYALLPGP